MNNEQTEDSAGAFDPVAFAEKWYEDHPETYELTTRFYLTQTKGLLDAPEHIREGR